jgi:VIT1/CCC1 family predicted Fe2+/Mn2+ transporter
MEKLLGLLHEGTIIDLRALYTAALRYKIMFVGAFVLFAVLLGYNFYNQPTIYAISIPLKADVSHKISTDLSSLLPTENLNPLTVEEIDVSLSSFNFVSSLSQMVAGAPEFKNMNFGNMKAVKPFWGWQIAKKCSDKQECIVENLTGIIRPFYSLEGGTIPARFNLIVNSIDKTTTKVLSTIIVKAIEQDRVRLKQLTVQKEINNVSHLIDESKSMMIKMGGYEVLQEQEKLQNNIESLKDQIKMLQLNASLETANSSALQAKLSETKKRTTASVESKENYEALLKVQNRLNEIRQNILFLSHSTEDSRSSTDKLIIAQLKQERDRLIAALPAEQRMRAMQIAENLQEKHMENIGNVEFDYSVSKNKYSKLSADYEAARIELDKLLQKKIENETKINGMKADLDFLKSLEAKLMSLKLIKATMNSDLIFEDGSQFIEEFKKASLAKLALFSFFISAFLYLLALVIKHSLDDKIYDEGDVRLYFKNLEFVGEVPSFD